MNVPDSYPLSPRPEVDRLTPVHHGAADHAELKSLGLDPERVLDFSVNSSPYGPAPLVRQALTTVPLDRYPDREAYQLREILSCQLGVEMDQLLAGNGTAELLWLIAGTYLSRRSTVLTLEPTFGEYAYSARWMGAEVHSWWAAKEDGFRYHLEDITRLVEEQDYKIVYLCNPNNPTGQVLPENTLSTWSDSKPGTLFVVDEAYLHFSPGTSSAVSLNKPNILVLRSMTKDYSLAGLRLGYAVGHRTVIDALRKIRPPWNVNALAQAAGCAALQDQAHLEESMRRIHGEKRRLTTGLKQLGYHPLPSRTHYFLLPVEDGASFRGALIRLAIQVRDCASFGIPAFARIAPRTRLENERLLDAIRDIKEKEL